MQNRVSRYISGGGWFILGLVLIMGLLLGSPARAIAQTPPSPPSTEERAPEEPSTPSRSGLDADAISPEKVSQFVRAYLQVVTLIEQREGELQGAETETDSQGVQQAIEAEALGLIEAEGLTLQEYLQLLSLANIDPEFGDRIALQLQEAIN